MIPGRTSYHAGAVVAVAALVTAGGAAVALDSLGPGAGPLVQPLSSFAHTDQAWLWHLTIGAGTVGLLSLAGAVRPRATPSALSIALIAAGAGLAAAGACPGDLWFPWERPPTLSGSVHLGAVTLVLVSLSTAIAVRPRSLPSGSGGRWIRALEWAYGCAVLGSVTYLGSAAATGRPPHWFGLCERLVLGGAWAWSVLLAANVARRVAQEERAD